MKKKTIIITTCVVLAFMSILSFAVVKQPKVAFVHVQEIYNDFEYKKELEGKFETIKNSRKRILDSLEIQINALGQNIQNSEINKEMNIQNYQYLVTEYQSKQKTFTEDNENLSQKYSEQIWSQLNQYIKEFGELNDYDFIHGTDGSGSMLHAKKEYNVTTQLKDFANERYQGGALGAE